MNIHILGICGTFMGSLAQLMKACGHQVSGSDQNVYPPMSTQLEAAGIELFEGWGEEQFKQDIDLVVVGNVIARGNPAIEYVLNRHLPYTSGPAWLAQNILNKRWVLAVAGTHGKTTTSTMLAWILEYAGFKPGYLIGGVPANFSCSARLGESDFFVIEADEYDTAFFDKRSKCVHYQPDTLILNNLEFDHADIFDDLAAIQKQLHHCVRTVPSQGSVIFPADHQAIRDVLAMGCWSEQIRLGSREGISAQLLSDSRFDFAVYQHDEKVGEVNWALLGQHNVDNALAAIAAVASVGVPIATACEALTEFKGVKRRLEVLVHRKDLTVYDDFAHHPTAIATTLAGLRRASDDAHIIAIIEPRSNTMRMGVHQDALLASAADADEVWWFLDSSSTWSFSESGQTEPTESYTTLPKTSNHQREYRSFSSLLTDAKKLVRTGSSQNQATSSHRYVVLMSNGSFSGLNAQLIEA